MTKLRLLHHGARMTSDADRFIEVHGKRPVRVRSGSCGGLDIVLPGDVTVNVPVRERFAGSSPYVFRVASDDSLILHDERAGSQDVPVALIPSPAFQRSSTDLPQLARIGQVCFDRLGVGITNLCAFWRGSERRCQFCSIGLNRRDEERNKDVDDIVAVADTAFSDPSWPAQHMLLGGGTPATPDAGGRVMAQIARRVKTSWPHRSIYAMIAPPQGVDVLHEMRDAGIDEIGINLELFDVEAADRYMPGKHREIGRDRYWTMLEAAAEIFGPLNARSILIVGLESQTSTLRGVEELASRGVMPILSPFRPLDGTALENHPPPDPEEMWELALKADALAGNYGLPVGPTCLACQANTVTPPRHPAYRFYGQSI